MIQLMSSGFFEKPLKLDSQQSGSFCPAVLFFAGKGWLFLGIVGGFDNTADNPGQGHQQNGSRQVDIMTAFGEDDRYSQNDHQDMEDPFPDELTEQIMFFLPFVQSFYPMPLEPDTG
jgi:hypothetical protein